MAPLATLKLVHSAFLSSTLQLSLPLTDGQGRIQTKRERIRRREHPVVHPQGETYIALLLSLFRLPVWSHHTDISSSLAMASDSITSHLSYLKRRKGSPTSMHTLKLALLAGQNASLNWEGCQVDVMLQGPAKQCPQLCNFMHFSRKIPIWKHPMAALTSLLLRPIKKNYFGSFSTVTSF